jgi:hypothetical protein
VLKAREMHLAGATVLSRDFLTPALCRDRKAGLLARGGRQLSSDAIQHDLLAGQRRLHQCLRLRYRRLNAIPTD